MARSTSAKPGAPTDEPATEHDVPGLARRLAADGDWIASVTRDLTDAIHTELPELGPDEEMRRATYASSESNVRLFLRSRRTKAIPPRRSSHPPQTGKPRRSAPQA